MGGGNPANETWECGLERRKLLAGIGAAASGALAGCSDILSGSDTTVPTNEMSPTGAVDETRSMFVTALLPTVAVKTRSGPDTWQPRRVTTSLDGSMFGWQLATKQRPEQVYIDSCGEEVDQHTVPCRIIIGGETGAANRVSSVTLSTYGTCSTLSTGLPPDPSEVGGYELPITMVNENPQITDNARGFAVGGVELGVGLQNVQSVSSTDSLRGARAPAAPIGEPLDPNGFNGQYGIVRKPSERFSQALEEGYDRLRQLLTFTRIIYSAGIGTIASTGSRLLLTYGKKVGKKLASKGANAGILYIKRALTSEGTRVPSENQLRRARMVEGTAFFPPRTDSERRAFDIDNPGFGSYGYGAHEKGEGEITDVALGFSGPFVSLAPPSSERSTPTRTSTPESGRFEVALDPTATYKRLSADDEAPVPEPVNLAEQNISPGDELTLRTVGTYVIGPSERERCSVIGVFSRTAEILSGDRRDRVPGAVDAGTDYKTVDTLANGRATDVPEDFLISGSPEDIDECERRSTTVTVPDDASYLFLAVEDDRYRDNSGNIRVVIEPNAN